MNNEARLIRGDPLLSLEARKRIYQIVVRFPGLHFRALQRRLSMAPGSLDYHLSVLVRNGLLDVVKDSSFVRFYRRGLKNQDMQILGLLRQSNIRRIVLLVMSQPGLRNSDIAASLRLSPSTISWYMQKLEKTPVVKAEREGRESHYYVIDQERIIYVLSAFRESFLDKAVDKYVEIWETTRLPSRS